MIEAVILYAKINTAIFPVIVWINLLFMKNSMHTDQQKINSLNLYISQFLHEYCEIADDFCERRPEEKENKRYFLESSLESHHLLNTHLSLKYVSPQTKLKIRHYKRQSAYYTFVLITRPVAQCAFITLLLSRYHLHISA